MVTCFIIGFLAGAVIGAGVALIVGAVRSRGGDRAMREAFSALAAQALDENAKRLAERAGAALEGKKALIDQAVVDVGDRLGKMNELIQRIETERKGDLGRLGASVASLATTAGDLHKMLASPQRRGAWGERMAEDVLNLVGLQEGINYEKQSSADAESGRPDFTFRLPNDLKVNMDVKFPLDRYKTYLDAADEAGRAAELQQLVAAVRNHIRAVAGRGYIDPKVPTVPYVIVFIPAEQLYSLVLEANPDLIDDALRSRVVLSSPLTLYAMLAVIRQAAENANVMKTADEVITLLAQFSKQWQRYNDEVDKLGERIEALSRQYATVTTTRTNMLQRQMDKVEDIRTARGLPGGDGQTETDT